ncbi:MAG: hypothetical protein ABIF77_06080 [bacterium]
MQIQWSIPGWGWLLLLTAAVAGLVWTRRQYRLSEPAIGRRLRFWLVGLRFLALICLLLAIARPLLHQIRHESRIAEVVILVEDSASMALATETDSTSRWERARELVARADSLLQQRDIPVHCTWLRGNGLTPSQPFTLPAATPPPPVAVGSDHAVLVREVTNRWAERPLRGLILLTDGNDTAEQRGPGASATNLGSTALLALGLGDPTGPADRFIQDLRYPDTAFAGDEVVVEVSVASRFPEAMATGEVVVRLLAGEEVVARASAPPETGSGITRLELTVAPESPGLQVYELEVAPLDNERYLSNNRASVAVNVRKERARLLLLAGRPHWDLRFLAQAARHEERLQVDVVYLGQSGLVLADSSTSPTWSPPGDVAGWSQWDGIVLFGWTDLRERIDWGTFSQAVRAGRGLLVLPDGTFAHGGAEVEQRVEQMTSPLAELLPVRLDLALWEANSWFGRGTAVGGRHPLLAGVTYQVTPGNEFGSGRLPPLMEVASVTLRPDAIQLLTAAPQRAENEQRSSRESEHPLLVLGQAGQGNIAWFGGRQLWELAFWEPSLQRNDLEEQPARRLLRNLLLWTAKGEEDSGLTLVGHRTVYREGERIRLEAQWRDLRGTPVTDRALALELAPMTPESRLPIRTYSMDPLPGHPGHAEVLLPPVPPGQYRVRPRAADDEQIEGREAALVVTPHSLEATQVRQDSRFLRQLASGLGGSYASGNSDATDDRLVQFCEDLDLAGDVLTLNSRRAVWSGWPLLTVASLLLGAEWVLRRRHGLL